MNRSVSGGLVALASALGAIALWSGFGWLALAAFAIAGVQAINSLSPSVEPLEPGGKYVLRLLGLTWTLEEFLTHWVIVMRSGHGKTGGILRTMISQLMQSVPEFGAIAIDEKANLHSVIDRIMRAFGRPEKLIVLRTRRPGRDQALKIEHRINLIGDRTIPWETYAQIVIDVAVACGQETSNSFFKNQGRKAITKIFETLDVLGVTPTLADAYDFIAYDGAYKNALERLQIDSNRNERAADLLAFWQALEMKGGDERSGIKSTTELYLYPYSGDELREVFSSDSPNVTLDLLDQGKILCPSVPQALLTQRRYIIAWFKLAGYYHLLRRFDEYTDEERKNLTPIVIFADEGQNSLLAAEEGLADHNTLDKIREARGTFVLLMQSYSSALPSLKGKRELAETIFTNLNNHVIGAIRDETGREMAANIFGKDWIRDKSWSYGSNNRTTSIRRELRHIFHTGVFTRLRKFQCLIFHVEGRWAKGMIPPLTDDGRRVAGGQRLAFWRNLLPSG